LCGQNARGYFVAALLFEAHTQDVGGVLGDKDTNDKNKFLVSCQLSLFFEI
jgi:hypothetical protein